MSDTNTAPAWVIPVMRAGYLARAAVYVVVGGLALLAAIRGGQTQGTTNALADLQAHPGGLVALWAIGLGLLAYMIWRLIDAAMDLEDYGSDAKGLFARCGLVITGLIHGAIGVSVLRLAIMGGGGGGVSGAESLTARLMAMPFGPWLVGAVGLATIGAGGYYGWKGLSERYKKMIRVTPTTERLDPVMKAGLIAEGLVVAIVGALIVYAAITTDPSQAGGVGEALGQIRSVAFGRILLGVIALGLIGFAVENVVEGLYRILPRYASSDTMTLARKAKAKAKGAVDDATS